MKKSFSGFVSGIICTLLVGSLVVSALAITGRMTIDVDPINIQVNGETFVPKDVTGKEVPVFAYEGTTYAPLRALAEAYGLEVGYDAATNMATVNDPETKPEQPATPNTTASVPDYSDWNAEDEAAYQEFKGMWEYHNHEQYLGTADAIYSGNLSYDDVVSTLLALTKSKKDKFSFRVHEELITTKGFNGALRFKYDDASLLYGVTQYDGQTSCPIDNIFKD